MRNLLIVLGILLCSIAPATAQVSVGIGLPGVSIGFNVPVYPQLIAVPGYPVYYAPQVSSNYFFYDGMYWVYQGDNWYASSWYNGPWELVTPDVVPLFVLRVPVRYYRRPPAYFHGWRSDAPPHWGEHWGDSWAQRRSGWDNWNHASVPAPAPLPVYQRQYSGNRYPQAAQQQALQSQNYRYQPQEAVAQQHYQASRVQSAPAPSPQARQAVPREKSSPQQDQRIARPPSSPQQSVAKAPQGRPQENGGGDAPKHAAKAPPQHAGPKAQPQAQPPQQAAAPREQKARGQDKAPQQAKGPAQEPKAQHETPQQPTQGAVQPRVQTARAEGQDKGPQGKNPAHEAKQGQEKGEQQGGEHNN